MPNSTEPQERYWLSKKASHTALELLSERQAAVLQAQRYGRAWLPAPLRPASRAALLATGATACRVFCPSLEALTQLYDLYHPTACTLVYDRAAFGWWCTLHLASQGAL